MNTLDWNTLYWTLPLAAACICSLLALYLLRHRNRHGATALMLTMAAVAEWSFAYAMEFRTPGLAAKLWWVKTEYVGGGFVGLLCLLFIAAVTGTDRWFTAGRLAALSAIPVLVPILAFTNEYHGLMWQRAWLDPSGPAVVMAYDRGVGFWIFAGYSYVLLLAGTAILVKAYRRTQRVYRRQIGIILFGIAIPWLSNATYLSGTSPITALDLTPFAFTLSGIIFSFGLFRFQLLNIVPIAREALLEGMGEAVIVLGLQDRIMDANSRAHQLLAADGANLVGKSAPGTLPAVFDAVENLRSRKEQHTEIRLESAQGGPNYDLRVSPLFSRKERHVGWLVCLGDITERKQAESAIRDSEEKFRSISAHALDGIVMVDPGGRISFWNRAAEIMFGYTGAEILGKELHAILAPGRFHDAYREQFAAFVQTGTGPVIGKTVEMAALRRDGTEFPIELSVASLFLKGEWHAVGIVRDITDRKQAEAEKEKLQARLQRAQKMEAIGTLAGGVAHDLNNILSGIVSYPDLLLMQIPEDSPLRQPIHTIRESGKRAAAIVQDLLTLARRGVDASDIVNLNTVVSEYLRSPEFEKLCAMHPRVHVTPRLPPDLPNIAGSALHLSKTVMNLVINAAEAMADGGEIVIRTRTTYIDQPVRGYESVAAGEYVTLAVADSGIGIPEKDRQRIFEPFYTKKHMGRSGTGLGMAVVWGSVKDHRGYIDIDSTEGVGTTFTLYFPVCRREASKPAAAPVGLEAYQGKGETVLVVDDVPEQRTIAAGMLAQLGYTVHTVASGEAALRWLARHRVDLVILDMIMTPGMDGLDTHREIRMRVPGQRVLIASGFSETDRVLAAQRDGAGAYIKKPYTMQTLAMALRRELDG